MFNWFEKLVDPFPEKEMETPPAKLFPFLWHCSQGARGHMFAIMALTATLGMFEAALFSMMGGIVDWLSTTSPKDLFDQHSTKLWQLLAILAASPLAVLAQTLVKRQAVAGNFPMRLRWNFHRLMLSQSMSFYQDEFAGRVASKVMQTALAVRDAWLIVVDILVFVTIYFATMGWLLGGFHWSLLLAFVAWLGLYILEMAYFVPRLGAIGEAQADARSVMNGRITDAYSNIATVKLFSHSRSEAAYAKESMSDFMATAHQQMRLVSLLEVFNHLLSVALIASTAGVALWLWSKGELGVGSVAAATAMAVRLNGISHWIMWEMAALFEHAGSAQDGLATLSKPRLGLDHPSATPLQVTRGAVRFESVRFGYGGARPVLDGFSLDIASGEKIGLVGRSGAGKSTALSLLLRFYDPESGSISIDGHGISDATQESLRAQIGMVTQDTSLLHRSVRDNLKYGNPDATDDAMIHAARMAKADEFIDKLADSNGRTAYDSRVGERGVKLSGGQRQRIAIARVILKNAPILLLDEATSALDSEVEQAIQESLAKLMEGKTVVAIAHRLSTIAAMDRLVVMDQGRIAEQGTHAELLAAGGIYATLWEHQTGGFLGER